MDFVLDARDYVAFQRELRGALKKFGAGRIRYGAGFALESREQRLVVGRVLCRAADGQRQLFFCPSAPHSQIAVRVLGLEQRLDRLVVIEIAVVLAVLFRLFRFDGFRGAPLKDGLAREFAQLLGLGQSLGQDVLGASDRGLGVVDILFGVVERQREDFERLPRLRRGQSVAAIPYPVGERLQPRLFGDSRFGFALLLVRQVDVFERIEVEGRKDFLFQLVGQLALTLYLLDDEGLALDDLVPSLFGVNHVLDRDLVERAGLFFAVAGDEWDCSSFSGQGENRDC